MSGHSGWHRCGLRRGLSTETSPLVCPSVYGAFKHGNSTDLRHYLPVFRVNGDGNQLLFKCVIEWIVLAVRCERSACKLPGFFQAFIRLETLSVCHQVVGQMQGCGVVV